MTSARDALRDAVPIVIGYVTLGLAAGMLLVAEGLSWWWAPLWSLVIYSGTMQMLLVPLAGAGEPLAAIAASTAFVSGRHVFYGLGFPLDRVRGRLPARLYAVHAITDEVYALLASKDRSRMSGRYIVTVEAVSHLSWASGTTAGALAGTGLAALVGEDIELLGFVLTSLFVVLAIENWRNHPDLAVLIIGVLAGAAGMAIGGSAALLSALGVLAVGLIALYVRRRGRPRPGRAPGTPPRGGGRPPRGGGPGRGAPPRPGRAGGGAHGPLRPASWPRCPGPPPGPRRGGGRRHDARVPGGPLMLTDPRIAIAVVVVAAITFACRIAPFALLRGRGGGPLVDFLSSAMPLGVMIVLVAYTLDGVGTDPATWLPALAGIGTTAGLHLWRRSIGLSLIGGTGIYVVISLLLG